MKNKKRIWLSLLLYLYLALPTLIFMIGWLKWYFAFPFGMLTAFACVRAFTVSMRNEDFVPEPADISTFLDRKSVV